VKSREEIDENIEILQYPVDTFMNSEMLNIYYTEQNIPLHVIDDFTILLKDDLYFEYLDRLCVFHFIEKSSILHNVNCYLTTSILEDGNFIVHLKTTRKINSDEKLIISRGQHHDQNNIYYEIKYFIL
jgi:hypothetical protein